MFSSNSLLSGAMEQRSGFLSNERIVSTRPLYHSTPFAGYADVRITGIMRTD